MYTAYYFAHDYECELVKGYLEEEITKENLIDSLESSGLLTDGGYHTYEAKPWGNNDRITKTNYRAPKGSHWVISVNQGLGYVGVTLVEEGDL